MCPVIVKTVVKPLKRGPILDAFKSNEECFRDFFVVETGKFEYMVGAKMKKVYPVRHECSPISAFLSPAR